MRKETGGRDKNERFTNWEGNKMRYMILSNFGLVVSVLAVFGKSIWGVMGQSTWGNSTWGNSTWGNSTWGNSTWRP